MSVIGINENGADGLTPQAREIISAAGLVVGGRRHLQLAGSLVKGESRVWASPVEQTIKEILACRQQKDVCVLASGDPFCYGVGSTLARYVPIVEMLVIPAPSAFSLATAKLGWALQDIVTIGLNGRAIERIIPHLQPKARILALSTDETTPSLLAGLLVKQGFADSKFYVLEHLGGEKERIRECTPSTLMTGRVDIEKLNIVAIEIVADKFSKVIPVTSGVPDELFEHDGQITKREIRAITLSSLAPRKGQLLWDIGLGAGSVAIEWLLCDPANRAIGFEKNHKRAGIAGRNALALGVPGLQVIEGGAPEILQGVEAPDAIFIGGGAGNQRVIEAAWNALKPGGRMVINCVTLETEAVVIAAHRQYGGNIIRIGIERAEAIGSMTGLRPAMSVLQWSACK